jgi:hypothetical protein
MDLDALLQIVFGIIATILMIAGFKLSAQSIKSILASSS